MAIGESRVAAGWLRGAGCTQVVWRQALRAEAQAAARRCFALLLWDLSDFYKGVNRDKLLTRAKTAGFSLSILWL